MKRTSRKRLPVHNSWSSRIVDSILAAKRRVELNQQASFVLEVIRRFGADNGWIFAAGLAFFMLLSFAPLILTTVAVLGFFIHKGDATLYVTHAVKSLLPAGGASAEAQRFVADRLNVEGQAHSVIANRELASVLGLLALIWASIQVFVNGANAMNGAWEVEETRNWFVLRAISLCLLVASGTLILLTIYLSAAPLAIARLHLPIIGSLPGPHWAITFIFEILAVAVNAVLFLLIFKVLPNADVPWRAAMIGGLVTSVLWEIAKKGLAFLILRPI